MKKSGSKTVRNIILTIVFALLYFYFKLPAINFKHPGFYGFFVVVMLFYCALTIYTGKLLRESVSGADLWYKIKKKCGVPLAIACALIVIQIIGGIIGSPIIRASAYSKLLPMERGTFAEDIAEISFDKIPMLDSTSADTLANRKLGELSDLVSQFNVDPSSVQINFRDKPVRVTYLHYGDFFKWLNNSPKGIPAYMVIDMVTQEVTVPRLEKGMRYSPSEYFFRDVDRYLRFKYPTYIFSDTNLELNEEGEPYWVASVMTKRIGLFGGKDIEGAVLLNAVTGESTYLDVKDIPAWVDRVYDADLIIEQYDYYGRYHNGFFNSLFGQRGVTVTTDGYNYLALDDDVWMYTGVTSVGGDESNIGFILVNQRTKEAKYYAIAGAEEYSAMNSAEGAVQQYRYSATFPLLLNISGQPTYFMALKDSSQLVKMYAMVNVQQYQITATGTTVAACKENYLASLYNAGLIKPEDTGTSETPDSLTVTGEIAEIRSAVRAGSTVFYIRLEGDDFYYLISVEDSELAAVLNEGDKVTLVSSATEGELREAVSVVRAP